MRGHDLNRLLCVQGGPATRLSQAVLRRYGPVYDRALSSGPRHWFIERAASMPGIKRIAFVGFLTKEKVDPKDADVLVTVDDEADLTALATAARKLKGAAQTRNKGADVFLSNPAGCYVGRVCHWRECGPGIRTSFVKVIGALGLKLHAEVGHS